MKLKQKNENKKEIQLKTNENDWNNAKQIIADIRRNHGVKKKKISIYVYKYCSI